MLTILNVVITFLVPIYKSYKCLNVGDAERQAYWLMYWVIIGCLSCVEGVLRWIPLYTYMKLGFVVYLEMQGSQVVYDTLIKEVLQRHETEIEVGLRKLKGGVYDLAVKYLKVIYGSLTSQGQQEEFIPLETEQTEHTQNSNLSQFISSYTPAVISTQLNSQLKRRGRGDEPATQPVQPAQTAQRKATKPPTNSQPEQSSSASSWLFGYL